MRPHTSFADLLADESFVKYCTHGEDSHFWENYIRENPEQKPLIEEAKKMLFLLREGYAEEDLEMQLNKLKLSVAKQKEKLGERQLPPAQKTKIRRLLPDFRYAAAAAAIILLVFTGYQYLGNQDNGYKIYASEMGSRKTIVLPDSTHVILNSNSVLKVPEKFNKQNRKVLLSGAAFFEVTHDEQHPFSVTTGKLVTKVLGTTFFVRDYHNEENTSVLLLTGKVKVKALNQNKEVELKPGEKVVVNRKSGQFFSDDFNQDALKNWKFGRLAFNNAPFEKVVQKLELWYGVQINVQGDKNKDLRFTGRFDNETLGNILKVISFTMNCQYEIVENRVSIHF